MSPKLTNPRKNNSIIEKLYLRECNVNRNSSRFSNDLSSSVAWNIPRLQNMILAVGPGTPNCMSYNAAEEDRFDASSSDTSSQHEDDNEEDESSASVMYQNVAEMSSGSGDDDENEEGKEEEEEVSSSDEEVSTRRDVGQEMRDLPQSTTSHTKFAPSLRHRGCINTACWLQCPWRLSLTPNASQTSFSSNDSISIISPSFETPTQLITSGDDRVVKFWDVRHAMGNISPIESPATALPFAYPQKNKCNKYYPKHLLPGGVVPLYSLNTGHRGNIFHVEALPFDAGKVLTCAADGYLRLSDVVVSNSPSSVVLGPTAQGSDNYASIYSSRSNGMCFSFHLINSNVGLVCTERGLKKFDLRLSPRQQSHENVLHQDRGALCKACAIWKKPVNDDFYEEDVGSHYVFAGGSGAEVRLYDLRMESNHSSTSRVVQKYRPTSFLSDNLNTNGRGRASSRSSGAVSVSGLDLSKDLRELLVSYENDQIYTFTIFPNVPPSGPTLSDIHKSSWYEDSNDTTAENEIIPIQTEKASYGAHLNRFTFLKSAKYAGPNDEYICTGSDSGHVWIYVRKTGEVASLLRADNSTCNGVVPHPTLPFFVTYGIDSTAKLWRATVPVGDVDDSPLGRYDGYVHTKYEPSALVSNWKAVQSKLSDMEHPHCPHMLEGCSHHNINVSLLPDQIPSREEEVYEDSIFGALLPHRNPFSNSSSITNVIKNDYTFLPTILQQNYYAALKGKLDFVQELMGDDDDDDFEEDDEPIRSGLDALHKRVSLIRLYYQARRLGLVIDHDFPWIMSTRKRLLMYEEECGYGHPADLIPDYSDWLMYDIEMTPNPKPFHLFEEIDDVGSEDNESTTTTDRIDNEMQDDENIVHNEAIEQDETTSKEKGESKLDDQGINQLSSSPIPHPPNDTTTYTPERAWEILTKTVLLLKEAGNEALKSNQILLAATRYDKSIRYASIGCLPSTPGNLSFLTTHIQTLKKNNNRETSWTPLLKTLISVRLNLSMTLLKPEIQDTKTAINQASLAVDALAPFCVSSGKVFSGKHLEVSSPAPTSIFHECKELQAKAHFRLGTAQNANKDYVSAISSLEKSIACSKDIGVTRTDPSVGRLLREAKQELAKRKKRHRKKFKSMFSS